MAQEVEERLLHAISWTWNLASVGGEFSLLKGSEKKNNLAPQQRRERAERKRERSRGNTPFGG